MFSPASKFYSHKSKVEGSTSLIHELGGQIFSKSDWCQITFSENSSHHKHHWIQPYSKLIQFTYYTVNVYL